MKHSPEVRATLVDIVADTAFARLNGDPVPPTPESLAARVNLLEENILKLVEVITAMGAK